MKSWIAEQKITSCFAAVVIMVAILSWISVLGLSSMNRNYEMAVDSTAQKIRFAGEINRAVSDMIAADRSVLLYTHEKNTAGVEAAKKLFSDRAGLIEKDVAELKPLVSSDEERHALDVVARRSAEWQNVLSKMERLCAAGDVEAASKLEAGEAMPLYRELDGSTGHLQGMQLSSLKTDEERAASIFRFNRFVLFALLALAFLISVIAFIVVRRIGATLLEAKQAAGSEANDRKFHHSLICAIHEVSLDGILVVNSEGNVVSHNKRFLDVWQLPVTTLPDYLPDPATGISDQPLLSANLERVKDPETFLKRVRELYDDPDASDHCEIELKDGRTLERYSTCLRDETGGYLGRVWFFRDITIRKQAVQELQNSEEKFRQFAENIHGVFWMKSPSSDEMLYVSPAYEKVWGRTCASLYQSPMSWVEAIHPDDLEQAHFIFAQQIRGEPVESEYRIRTPDGQEKWIRDQAFPIRDQAGQLIRIAGIAEEITGRKCCESKLVATNQALNQAQKMEAMGRLAGGIAHDFNNLLMVIQSYTEMLQDRLPADDALRKNTQQILKASKRAASLTGQMLAFSRKQLISPVVLDLNMVVNDTTKMLKRLIGEDIEFRIDSAEPLWAIEADPDQIGQVLMNLCVNSRDAMPQGGTLTIATGNVRVDEGRIGVPPYVAPGEYVRLSAIDTGTGISKEEQKLVFEPFFTTKDVGKGTGLGLAMVYGVVKQSGGYVWVESELGHGTCFTIYLPRSKGAVAFDKFTKAEVRLQGTETLLVVEDEEALRDGIRDYLENLGYTVLAASSGQRALSIASQQPHIDLLITDVVMPKMSGRELSQILGNQRHDLKIIHMSGYTDDAVLRHSIHKLGTTLLQKPFGLSTLARKVRDTLDSTMVM